MDQMYDLEDGSKLAVYSYRNYLYVHTLPLALGAHPMLLCTDYAGKLYSCDYLATIYYIYENTEGNLVLSNLLERKGEVIFRDEARIFQSEILWFGKHEKELFLVLKIENPVSQITTLEWFSLKPDLIRKRLYYGEKGITFRLVVTEKKCYLLTGKKDDGIYSADFSEIEKTLRDNTLSDLDGCMKEIPTVVTEKITIDNCRDIKEKLNSVTKQYNELADTARKIQAEGRQWKALYQGRFGK